MSCRCRLSIKLCEALTLQKCEEGSGGVSELGSDEGEEGGRGDVFKGVMKDVISANKQEVGDGDGISASLARFAEGGEAGSYQAIRERTEY